MAANGEDIKALPVSVEKNNMALHSDSVASIVGVFLLAANEFSVRATDNANVQQ